jgi:hypothetical protein
MKADYMIMKEPGHPASSLPKLSSMTIQRIHFT